MSIIRSPKVEKFFYTLDKRISEDRRLSWQARGLLIYLLGKPDHWKVSVEALKAETIGTRKPTSRDGIYSILDELTSSGYVVRQPARDEYGRMAGFDYMVNETPLPDLPLTAEPLTANPTLVSTDSNQGLKEVKKHLCDEAFEKAWSAYPKRDGSNPKAAAQKCWNARLKEGVTVEEMANGINRYRAYCAGKETIGTAFVMQAARFLGTNREYEAAWSAPAGLSSAPAGKGKRPRPTNLPDHKFPHPEWDNGVYEICTVGRHNPETGYLLPGQY